MTTVIFVRHGEYEGMERVTAFRKPGFHLSPRGKKQVEKIAKKLAGEKATVLYSSPITRCVETAEIIRKQTGLPVRVDDTIIEVNSPFAGWEKTKLDELVAGVSLYDLPRQRAEGETLEEVALRMERFFGEIVKKHKDKTAIVISHGDPIMILVAKLTGQDFSWASDNYIKCGEYFRIEYQNSKAIKAKKYSV